MAQPAMAITGSAARRASDFPTDHPAILIAAPSPGGTGDCHAAHEKSHTAFPVRLLSRPPLYGSRRLSTIIQGRNGFIPPLQYCGSGATGMELRIRGGYIGRAVTGLERRNNNNGETT
jgi:hypothetical protein